VTTDWLDPDVVGIAAPVRDERQQVVAAVSIVALSSRVFPEAEFARKVREPAQEISSRLISVIG